MKKFIDVSNEIKKQINKDQLLPGAKLPSLRDLSVIHGVSKATISNALSHLKDQQVIYPKERKGYFVSGKDIETSSSISTVKDFSSRAVGWKGFPFEDIETCYHRALAQSKEGLFAYGNPQGEQAFIKVLRMQLENLGVYTQNEGIFVTSGVHEALYILTQLDFPSDGNIILVEEPTYDIYLKTLRSINVPVMGITRNSSGIDLSRLEWLFKNKPIKFFYLMPRHHNPLGTTLSKEVMQKIVNLAEKYNVYLVEDDYLSDINLTVEAVPLHYYDTWERVIYLRSFSKIIYPGLRIGVAVLPPKLRQAFWEYKQKLNISTDTISQLAMRIYIENGMFEKNKRTMSISYHNKAQRLFESIEEHLGIFHPFKEVSLHTCLSLPLAVNKASFVSQLKKKDILVDSMSANFLDESQHNLIKIGVTAIEMSQIDEGIQEVAKVLELHLARI